MKIIIILACMELSGIGINPKALQGLSSTILNKMQSLETQAYELAGKKFNLLSSKEVSQVCSFKKTFQIMLHLKIITRFRSIFIRY